MPPRRRQRVIEPNPQPNPDVPLDAPMNPIERRNRNRPILQTRRPLIGRLLNANNLEEYQLSAFHDLGWNSFNAIHTYNHDYVVEFYAGFHYFPQTRRIELQFFDRSLSYSQEEFGEILGIPHAGLSYFTTSGDIRTLNSLPDITSHQVLSTILRPGLNPDHFSHLTDNSLRNKFRVWNKIIISNIFPKAGEVEKVGAMQALLLYCLEHRVQVNMVHLICCRMSGLEQSRRLLPYGGLLSRFFAFLQFPTLPQPRMPVPISYDTVNTMHLEPEGGIAAQVGEGAAHDDAAAEVHLDQTNPHIPPPAQVTLEDLFRQSVEFRAEMLQMFGSVNARLDSLQEQVDVIQESMIAQDEERASHFTQLQDSIYESGQATQDHVDQMFQNWNPFPPPY